MAERPNWFVGLPVPAEGWYRERVLRTAPEALRVFPPDDLHLTLAFLGSVDEARARAAWEARDCWDRGAITASLGPVVPLGGDRHRFRVLAARLDGGDEAVAAGMRACQPALLDAAGLPPPQRPPLPHVTLGRAPRRLAHRERRALLRWAEGLDLAGVPVPLEEVALYTWSDDRPKRLFRIVERAPLGAADA